jgi:hypothetical protein
LQVRMAFITFRAFRLGEVEIEIQIEPRPADGSWGLFSSLLGLDYRMILAAASAASECSQVAR